MAQEGIGTYYTASSCRQEGNSGTYTASGEVYDESALTAALPHRRFGGSYRVCNKANGRCVVVKHNDLGPSKRLVAQGKIIDLSPAAYDALGGKRGINRRGIAWGEMRVSVEPVK